MPNKDAMVHIRIRMPQDMRDKCERYANEAFEGNVSMAIRTLLAHSLYRAKLEKALETVRKE